MFRDQDQTVLHNQTDADAPCEGTPAPPSTSKKNLLLCAHVAQECWPAAPVCSYETTAALNAYKMTKPMNVIVVGRRVCWAEQVRKLTSDTACMWATAHCATRKWSSLLVYAALSASAAGRCRVRCAECHAGSRSVCSRLL
jgi:hypothetical protein